MVTILQEQEVDLEAEDREAEDLDAALAAPVPVDDLRASSRRNGGPGGNRVSKGRNVSRPGWRYDGTPSVLTISWNPEGTRSDNGREYLKKKICLCCNEAGFKLPSCPKCIRINCSSCSMGRDKAKVIRLYYTRLEDVPHPRNVKNVVDCFLPSCTRKGIVGFPTLEAMLLHARSKHRMEYASFREAEEMRKSTEADDLRKRVDELTSLLLRNGQAPGESPKKERTPAQVAAAQNLGAGSKARWAARKVANEAGTS